MKMSNKLLLGAFGFTLLLMVAFLVTGRVVFAPELMNVVIR